MPARRTRASAPVVEDSAPATTTMTGAAPLSPSPPDEMHPSIEKAQPDTKPASALTPPTSEEMNHEVKHDDSELSDLDMSEDEGEEVVPDHYWDGGKIPVFKPTMEQFKSFKKYIEKIDKYGMKSGIVKVIPPPEWRDSLPKLNEMVKQIRIKNPITQEFNGTLGTYTQQNVEKQRSYNLPEWKSLTEETQYQPPAKRGERRKTQKEVVRGGGALRGRAAANAKKAAAEEAREAGDEEATPAPEPVKLRRKPGRKPKGWKPEDDEEEEMAVRATRAKNAAATGADKPPRKKPGRPPGGGAGQAKSVASRRLNNTMEAADFIDEKAFKDFDYHMEGLDEFTPERCAELETHYWKSLGFNQPMYAADMPGSLFDDKTNSWNVSKLENLLDVLGTKIPGVNTAYLYMGMWKATFAWHLEDVDLYSINYIHFGAPKQWYSISQEDARRFEKAMKSVWPVDAKGCDQFLRHKTYLISPDVLAKQYNVKVNKLVHYEGEFVITYPYGYHSGYNLGYNCAESVNFATESWLEYGRIARKCNCEADNVWVDVSEIERKLRGEPTPEYYEETDDDSDLDDDGESKLPTPPASVKGKGTSRKRKREVKQEAPRKKKKIRIRIRAPTREPCIMCPNDNPWEPLLPTENGKQAHRSCALFTPETFIANENGKEVVRGVNTIDRARLELKCNFCRSKRGACFQCCGKKCARAFHATCAQAAGVQIDAGPVPTFGEDGTEYFEEGFDMRCKMHRPKMAKNMNVEMLEGTRRVMSYARELKINDVVQAQLIGREVFAGLVVENRPAEMTVVVEVLPEMERVVLDWKYLCVLDPDDSLRPKPSPNALPMPEGMSKKLVSASNRQDGVPSQDDSFADNPDYKWHDFYNMHKPPQGYVINREVLPKIHVDLAKAEQLYYYLPLKSTEARCFFTDTVGGTEHVTRSSFLDRVSPPKPRYDYLAQQSALSRPIPVKAAIPRPQPAPLAQMHHYKHEPARPYNYKPRAPAAPNMLAVDTQALANQQKFTAQAGRQGSYPSLFDPPGQQDRRLSHTDSDNGNGTPLRPFSQDQYYSNRILPAAFPGEYSSFRRVSVGAQQRPQNLFTGQQPSYKSVSQQKTEMKHQSSSHAHAAPPNAGYAPTAPMMAHSGSNGPYSQATQPATHQHRSPYGAPAAPMWSAPGSSDRRPSQDYARPTSSHQPQYAHHATPQSLDHHQQPNNQWTPPSQRPPTSDSNHSPHLPPLRWPPAQHQTPQEFRSQIQHTPREGLQARTLPNKTPTSYQTSQQSGMGLNAFHSHHHSQTLPRNGYSFENAGSGAGQGNWESPKAPTASPLSDPNTPGQIGGGVSQQGYGGQGQGLSAFGGDWTRDQGVRADFAPMMGEGGR
ncbi:hypothetical protein B0A48_15309 [Cryoendolithus antarcticus]|uniref:[histone H3]-trimethyl-L-lysine(9) demethylase n=1 Tax=Cryoendolithus antarcticus TaxID=1507870 RepID=A0A1V8SHS7_9PEZI|nr:hypothetical protein B0A48_15309 [Cryoendolithus antarcticus]